ncbi:NUDIX domain protein [Pirellulimonas nuda]|uniref:NUDIX domain protein n=1 Tax=Pirellulimonas nuda TaxID=2528009 RepID=A0A518DHG6_9BACT|nr:NUDIX hydrolase [Pirellulimonas nuda]QDU90916.1 NUDIX domain protein [Pirellulimonas nuda]
MTAKPLWMFSQAGALAYVCDGDDVRVVLITSRITGKWIFPKGVIDPAETPESTACIEAREEAGVLGDVQGASLGFFEVEKWGGIARVEVFPLLVDEILVDWDERSSRSRAVVPVEVAKKLVDPELALMLEALLTAIADGVLPTQ